MGIYRGAGGTGDAINDASSETRLAVEARDAAIAAKNAAEAARDASLVAETNAETAETNAETAETNAETAATNASNSASAASTSATNAASSASSASTSATNAASSASAASTSATNAASSATAASGSASSASTSATNAANSATAAATSASQASTSATNASNSASAAATSATNAANSATSASTSASNAATSATNAANSATAAQTAETNAETAETNAAASASAAATSASNAASSASSASTSATNAANSASAAATSATNASNSASAAATSETNAAASATSASNSASAASTSATNASNSASAASTSATNAAASATSASNSASTATTQATNASNSASAAATSASNAATSATNAANSASSAATSATNAANSFDAFDDRYLGNKTSAPSLDNDGNALINGALYFDTTLNIMRVYSTTGGWQSITNALASEPIRHSVRPSLLLDFANTRTLDPRITFTRGSTGTFYDGRTVAKAEENLLIRSEEFDNGNWVKANLTVGAATTAPNGTLTGDTITASAGTAVHYIQQNFTAVAGQSYAISVYAKAGTHSFIQFALGSDNPVANFDISAGTVGTTTSVISSSITAVGNNWYRCSITYTAAVASTSLVISLVPSSSSARIPSWAAAGTETVELWGAQIEQRSSVTAYTATTTAPITNYIPALQTAGNNVARFEHNPVTGESLGLEIEEQRTNLLLYSDDFSNAAWTKNSSTVVSNTAISPDGTITADKLVPIDTSTAGNFSQPFSVTSGTAYTFSFYAKSGEQSVVSLVSNIVTGFRVSVFNLASGTVTTTATGWTASMTPVGNGWYRCISTFTATATASVAFQISNNTTGWTGNGFSGIYIWGAQLEVGSFATSYIPTVASQVTRSGDLASISAANQSWLNLPDGTFYVESAGMADTSARILSYGTASVPTFSIYRANATTYSTGITTVLEMISSTGYNSTTNKVAVNYVGLQPTRICVNAGTVGTYSGTVRQNIGSNPVFGIGYEVFDNGNQANTTIRKVAYYPKALTNAELQGLTTV